MGRSRRSRSATSMRPRTGSLLSCQAAHAILLSADDVAALAETIEPGTSAAVLVWENTSGRAIRLEVRQSGGQLVATGRSRPRSSRPPSPPTMNKEIDMPLAARRARRDGVIGPAPVARTAATVATAAVVAKGVGRRSDRRQDRRDDRRDRR